jgi:serine/threonine protein phosphatase 1
MKYFVSSDVHGFLDEWITALKEKQFNIDNPEHKIIVCGDLFDRGKQAKDLQAFVMKLIKGGKIILIRGNHEDLALDLIDNYANYMFDIKSSHHYYNGTFQTMLELTDMNYNDATTCLLEFKRRARETDYIKNIIPKMKKFYETDRYVFVHAWVPLKENKYEFNYNWRRASNKLWEKARWLKPLELYKRKLYLKDKTLVFGHWHCSAFWAHQNPQKYTEFGKNACFLPFVKKEIIALDACTTQSKRVNVVVLED